MNRLRHPVRAIREPFGTAGLIIACIALVAALGGSAFAAGKLTSKQKKEVEKIAKKYAGKPGANGPAGPQGAAGANGKDGAAGQNGTNGTNGTNGASVTSTELGPGDPNCASGGSEFKAGSGTPTYACNGSPWTASGTLPSGATETGTFALVGSESSVMFPISFAVPVEPAPEPIAVEYSTVSNSFPVVAGCPGIENGMPTADPGKLCVYVRESSGTSATPTGESLPPLFTPGSEWGATLGADSAGAAGLLTCEAGICNIAGVWAVTAE